MMNMAYGGGKRGLVDTAMIDRYRGAQLVELPDYKWADEVCATENQNSHLLPIARASR